MLVLIRLLFFSITLYSVYTVNADSTTYGDRQSPIDINTLRVFYTWASDLKWSYGYTLSPTAAYLNNTGSSISLTVDRRASLKISSGVLEVPYTFKEVHFHWGNYNGIGSEHKINSFSFPLEMHAVHTQSINNSIDEIVVVAYFFKLSPTFNLGLQNIIEEVITAARLRNKLCKIQPFPLEQLLPQRFSYFSYAGSLTTPPYTESVTWIISTEVLPITENQLNVFREGAKIDQGLRNNFRSTQKLNNRLIRFIPDVLLYPVVTFENT